MNTWQTRPPRLLLRHGPAIHDDAARVGSRIDGLNAGADLGRVEDPGASAGESGIDEQLQFIHQIAPQQGVGERGSAEAEQVTASMLLCLLDSLGEVTIEKPGVRPPLLWPP